MEDHKKAKQDHNTTQGHAKSYKVLHGHKWLRKHKPMPLSHFDFICSLWNIFCSIWNKFCSRTFFVPFVVFLLIFQRQQQQEQQQSFF